MAYLYAFVGIPATIALARWIFLFCTDDSDRIRVRLRLARGRIAACFALAVIAGCSRSESFAVPCAKGVFGQSVAQHDFGTTDPTVLARVSALDEGVQQPGDDMQGQPGDAAIVDPSFAGSVAYVLCNGPETETVVFVLEAP